MPQPLAGNQFCYRSLRHGTRLGSVAHSKETRLRSMPPQPGTTLFRSVALSLEPYSDLCPTVGNHFWLCGSQQEIQSALCQQPGTGQPYCALQQGTIFGFWPTDWGSVAHNREPISALWPAAQIMLENVTSETRETTLWPPVGNRVLYYDHHRESVMNFYSSLQWLQA